MTVFIDEKAQNVKHDVVYVCMKSRKPFASIEYALTQAHVKKFGGYPKKNFNISYIEAMKISNGSDMSTSATAQKMLVGKVVFNSKSECQRYVKNIIEKYTYHNSVLNHWELSEEDNLFISELFYNYYSPDSNEDKIPLDSIERFSIKNNKGYGVNNYCFQIHLYAHDQPRTFSYKRCFQAEFSESNIIQTALRNEVHDQILVYKINLLNSNIKCPELGVALTLTNSEVDHVYPMTFSKIASDFISLSGLSLDDIQYSIKLERYIFKSIELSYNWRMYHSRRAKLQLISKQAHNSRTNNSIHRSKLT